MALDSDGRIMLANAALRCWNGAHADELYGRRAADLEWVRRALPEAPEEDPWLRAMCQRQTIKDEMLEIVPADRGSVKVLITCAPIRDGYGKVRGCLVTFNDVTALDCANQNLVAALEELQESRRQIEAQNEELRLLATRDPLTGCFNRRAFFEALDPLFAKARDGQRQLCCIMADIDHFKSFNDRYGHAVGDQVIQSVARALGRGLRNEDLLCRYGGEEFCIILPGLTLDQACKVAERLRCEIEEHAGASLRTTRGMHITSSFGVAELLAGTADPAELIDRADTALYEAKDNGRNRVARWRVKEAQEALD